LALSHLPQLALPPIFLPPSIPKHGREKYPEKKLPGFSRLHSSQKHWNYVFVFFGQHRLKHISPGAFVFIQRNQQNPVSNIPAPIFT
ncbi:hypothetical protein CI238_03785, partial [Colletotrichum incanum]